MRPDIDSIKTRCEAATEGPWNRPSHKPVCHGCDCEMVLGALGSGESEDSMLIVADLCGPECEVNAAFIAHSRQDIPALVAYVEELEAQIADEHVEGLA